MTQSNGIFIKKQRKKSNILGTFHGFAFFMNTLT